MCSSKTRAQNVARINGRPVLQPTCNLVLSSLERHNSLKKATIKSPTSLPSPLHSPKGANTNAKTKLPAPPCPPEPKSPKAAKNDPKEMNCKVTEKHSAIKSIEKSAISTTKRSSNDSSCTSKKFSSPHVVMASGSLAAARREQVPNMQAMRKLKIAHYGRTYSAMYAGKVGDTESPLTSLSRASNGKKRCSFVSQNSDPVYIAYHDEEWGVPVHDDRMLFELLVLTANQLGSDWTSVLKRRQHFRDAFSNFDAEIVAMFSEKKVAFICSEYGMELGLIRVAINNANQILKIKEQFGSLNNYLWRFVNFKPILTQYKNTQKIPVKTSKSEAISKDMIKRGFRFVGPAVIHSFLQAAGLTNDHLVSCPRHSHCLAVSKVMPNFNPVAVIS